MAKSNTVYWAVFSDNSNGYDYELSSLVKELGQSQKNYPLENLVACPAVRGKHINTYVSKLPYNLDIQINNNQWQTNHPEDVQPRQGLYDNSYAFDWRFYRIFFSPIPQMMESSPAFLHQTTHTTYGHALSGAFDIGRWFRPTSPAWQMWSNVNEFHALKGEAHLYHNFPNENKIQLQQFIMTDTLREIAEQNVKHKQYVPKQSLFNLYERFTRSGGHKKVLSEIKANLV